MITFRSLAIALCAASFLAACSGNMGSGATPPVSAPAVGAPVSAQAAASAAAPVHTGNPLAAQANIWVTASGTVKLPSAGGFSATLCVGPVTSNPVDCSATPVPAGSATPTPTPTPTPTVSPSATASPHGVLIAPPSKKWLTSGLRVALLTYPTAAPLRDDAADDGATNPLAMYDLTIGAIDLSMPGLDAFALILPQDQASPEHHYALVLYDRDQKTGHGTPVFTHKKAVLHGLAIAASVQLTGSALQFVDGTTAIVLTAKHHYTVVLYSDTVTPTPAPPTIAPKSAPTGVPSPVVTAVAFPTPYVSYPTVTQTPVGAAPPIATASP